MLHIVNKSPYESNALHSCLRMVRPGQSVVLIEDAIYAATTGNSAQALIAAAQSKQVKFYALRPDMDARGVAARALDKVTLVDYGGFVDLVAEHKTSNSWL